MADGNSDDLNRDGIDSNLETPMITDVLGAPRDGTGEEAGLDRKNTLRRSELTPLH
jgi:hypothetical protein